MAIHGLALAFHLRPSTTFHAPSTDFSWPSTRYGGTNPSDSSGVLRYVRVWHAGAWLDAGHAMDGVLLGGVGAGTVVEHVEVAIGAADGFAWLGGTVNVRFLSALFMGDDAFDVDEGYQGSGQFLFAMVGAPLP